MYTNQTNKKPSNRCSQREETGLMSQFINQSISTHKKALKWTAKRQQFFEELSAKNA